MTGAVTALLRPTAHVLADRDGIVGHAITTLRRVGHFRHREVGRDEFEVAGSWGRCNVASPTKGPYQRRCQRDGGGASTLAAKYATTMPA